MRAGKISPPRAHLVALVIRHFDANWVITAVEDVVRGLISDGILIAKLVADVLKRLVEIVDVIREKRAAAGFIREVLNNLVSISEVVFAVAGFVWICFFEGDPLRAGADGVDDHAGALRQFDGLGARVRGQIVFAVADENHHAANDVGLVTGRARRMVQLFQTSFINGIVNGGAAPGARAYNLVPQRSGIAGEGLKDLGLVVEGHDERLILVAAKHAVKKTDRSVLFKFEAVANAVRSVEQHADAQRQIGLLAEVANFLRLAFVKNFEIALLQIRHQFIAAI